MSINEALENIYTSLANENEDIDIHLAKLKAAMKETGEKQITIDPARLYQNNREGRKTLQGYFRKRGVKVIFKS